MLRIRLQRKGATHAPIYRIVVCESTSPRDGRFVEILGTYHPSPSGKVVPLTIKLDRVDYWLKCGAQPSDTTKSLIKRARKATAATSAETPAA